MVVLTLTLGIGANSAIFSAVDAVLLKPLPYPAADRLVSVYERNAGLRQATQLVAPGRLEEWNAQNRTFEALGASYFENITDTSGPVPERVAAMNTSPRFFQVLGVAPALGRLPAPQEERFGGPPVIVISDAFWRRRFGADPSVLGRALTLGGTSRSIVGVMPPSFRYPTAATDVWTPTRAQPSFLAVRTARLYTTVGRLKPGVTLAQALDDLNAIQARLGEQYPSTDKGWGASLVPLKEEQIGGVRRSLWLLLGAVGLVLLAACGNVACLLLADATRREHEMAIRLALGADRRRVVAELIREGLLLALIGSLGGLLLARWGLAALRSVATELPRIAEVTVDVRLILFTFAVGAATTLLFALAPALQAARSAPADALSRGGRGHTGGRQLLQRLLVGTQVALAIVLLTGAGLMIRSFVHAQDVSLGLDPDRVMTFRMSAQWSERFDAVVQRQARTVARLSAIPGVEAAAFSQLVPAGTDVPPNEFQIRGRDPRERTFAIGRSVSAGYFRTLHIPVLRGDTCSSDPAVPVFSSALVTRAFVERYFPSEDPIGHEFVSPGQLANRTTKIVGVVGDVREGGFLKQPEPLIYWCGYNPYWPDQRFLVRTSPDRACLDDGHPRGASGNRTWPRGLCRAIADRPSVDIAVAAATERDPPRAVRGDRTSTRSARPLRCALATGLRSPPRDWRSHGARRASLAHPVSRRRTGCRAHGARDRGRPVRVAGPRAVHGDAGVRRRRARSADVCPRASRARRGRSPRGDYPRATRRSCRPDGGPSGLGIRDSGFGVRDSGFV